MDTSSTKTMIRDWRDFQNVNNSPLFISVDLELSLYRLLERDEYTKKKKRYIFLVTRFSLPFFVLRTSFISVQFVCVMILLYFRIYRYTRIYTIIQKEKEKRRTKITYSKLYLANRTSPYIASLIVSFVDVSR